MDIESLRSGYDGTCQNKIRPIGPVLNFTVKTLNTNQDVVVDSNNNFKDIDSDRNRDDMPYRLLLQWTKPEIDSTLLINKGSINPIRYKIYRRLDNTPYTESDLIHEIIIDESKKNIELFFGLMEIIRIIKHLIKQTII